MAASEPIVAHIIIAVTDAFQACVQFYGRGLFARPPITWAGGPYSEGLQGRVRKAGLGTVTLLLSMLDQPLRLVSAGTRTSIVCPVAPLRDLSCKLLPMPDSYSTSVAPIRCRLGCRSSDVCFQAGQVVASEL